MLNFCFLVQCRWMPSVFTTSSRYNFPIARCLFEIAASNGAHLSSALHRVGSMGALRLSFVFRNQLLIFCFENIKFLGQLGHSGNTVAWRGDGSHAGSGGGACTIICRINEYSWGISSEFIESPAPWRNSIRYEVKKQISRSIRRLKRLLSVGCRCYFTCGLYSARQNYNA